MDQEIGIGGAVSLIFWFVRYRIRNMPNHVADGGILAGVLLILANVMEPDMKPNIFTSTVFLLSLLGFGYALHLWRGQKPSDLLTQNAQAQTVIENSGGGVGAEISVQGTPGRPVPNVGLETNGLQIKQSGPGTGAKIEVGGNGPAVGVRSNGPVIIEASPPPQTDK